MTRKELRALIEDLKEVLRELGKDHEVDLQVGRSRYGVGGGKISIIVSHLGEGGTVETPEKRALERARKLDPRIPAYGTTFSFNGREFRVIGYKPRSRKYPILTEDTASGRFFKFGRGILA